MSSRKASLGRLQFASHIIVTMVAKMQTPRALSLEKALAYSSQTDTSDKLS